MLASNGTTGHGEPRHESEIIQDVASHAYHLYEAHCVDIRIHGLKVRPSEAITGSNAS